MRYVLAIFILVLAATFAFTIISIRAQEPKVGFKSEPSCITYNKGDIYNPHITQPWYMTDEEYHSYDQVFEAYYVRCSVDVAPGEDPSVRWDR